MGEFDTDYKLFYRPLVDFGQGVGINESMEKYNLEEMNRRNQEQIQMDNIGMSEMDKYLNAIQLAGAYTVNPDSTFIKDPGGSGKMIKFTMPLDLRSVEEKMQRYPFVGAEGRFRA